MQITSSSHMVSVCMPGAQLDGLQMLTKACFPSADCHCWIRVHKRIHSLVYKSALCKQTFLAFVSRVCVRIPDCKYLLILGGLCLQPYWMYEEGGGGILIFVQFWNLYLAPDHLILVESCTVCKSAFTLDWYSIFASVEPTFFVLVVWTIYKLYKSVKIL